MVLRSTTSPRRPGLALGAFLWLLASAGPPGQAAWKSHTIDDGSRGADGVRLADINGDGLPDLATGWEEGGQARAYLHPGPEAVREPWPRVVAGRIASPEDALFVDIDGDGRMDVLSSCEGRTRSHFVHWAPGRGDGWNDPSLWRTQAVPASKGKQSWMFAMALPGPPGGPLRLAVGSKGPGASISLLSAPAPTRDLDSFVLRPLYQAGWIMSLREADVDSDGDADILASDRRGATPGVLWLENPGGEGDWRERRIGATGEEAMFLDFLKDPDTGRMEVAASSKPHRIHLFASSAGSLPEWSSLSLDLEANVGRAKGVCLADVDGDGLRDLVASCEGASEGRIGVFWIEGSQLLDGAVVREIRDISGPRGSKFDRIEASDLDLDGDLDIIACEEHENLGIVWYENPAR